MFKPIKNDWLKLIDVTKIKCVQARSIDFINHVHDITWSTLIWDCASKLRANLATKGFVGISAISLISNITKFQRHSNSIKMRKTKKS